MKIKLAFPKTTAEAIRLVAYLRAWSVRRLAKEIGANGSHLCQIVNHKATGTDEMTGRVLAAMPEGVTEE
jgi:hypothetical protein